MKNDISDLLEKEKKKRLRKKELQKAKTDSIIEIEIDKLVQNPYQPRIKYDNIDVLANSLKKNGQIQPIMIAPRPDGTYYIVAGHRRTKAAKLAGFVRIKAIVKKVTEEELRDSCMAENIHREQLSPAEISIFIKELIAKNPKIQKQEIASILGMSNSAITNYYKTTIIPEDILLKLSELNVTRDVMLKIAKIKDEKIMNEIVLQIEKGNIDQIEELISIKAKKKFSIDSKRTSIKISYGTNLKKEEQDIMEKHIKIAIKKAAEEIKKRGDK